MKLLITTLTLTLFFLFPTATQACFGFGCKSEVTMLGEVLFSENNLATIRPFHIFPKSSDVNENYVKIEDTKNYLIVGKKYALSLAKKDSNYSLTWEPLEVTGDTFKNAKLVNIKNADDALLQLRINNNGENPEANFFGAADGKLFVRFGDSDSPFFRDVQVYPDKEPVKLKKHILYSNWFYSWLSNYFFAHKNKKAPSFLTSAVM
jgi:hypothetical protein